MTLQTDQQIRIWLIMSLAWVTFLSPGCSRPNPNPELIDPIYGDLIQRGAVARAGAESKKGEIKTLRAELEALPARDTARKKTADDITNKEHLMLAAEQEALYYDIR